MRRRLTWMMVAATILVASTATAQAQEQTEDGKYSNIGGQLVPVGEKNKYIYAYKKNNVSTNPLSWFWGTFSAGYAYALSDNFAVRGDVSLIHYYDTTLWGFGVSASLPIFFKKMWDGFYLEPGVQLIQLSVDDVDGDSVSVTAYGPAMLLGWSWIWDAGFNVNLGIGVTYTWLSGENSSGDADLFDGPLPTGRLAFGYSF